VLNHLVNAQIAERTAPIAQKGEQHSLASVSPQIDMLAENVLYLKVWRNYSGLQFHGFLLDSLVKKF